MSLAKSQDRILQLRREMEEVEIPEPVAPDPRSLELIVESKLKEQLQSSDPKVVGWGVVNAIKFLAVKAKLPVAFGSELDDGAA